MADVSTFVPQFPLPPMEYNERDQIQLRSTMRAALTGVVVALADLDSQIGAATPTELDDLTDVTLTALGDNEVLLSSGGVFINRTLAEAGISTPGHTHVEADITDLDHYDSTDWGTDWEAQPEERAVNGTLSAGRLSGGAITDNGDGTVAVAAGTGVVKEQEEAGDPENVPSCPSNCGMSSDLVEISWNADASVTLTDNAYNYIYYDADLNGGLGGIAATTDFYSISFTRAFTLGRAYRSGTTVTVRLCGTNLWSFPRRVQLFGEEYFPIVRAKGLVIAETGERYLTMTEGVLWAELVNRFSQSALDTSGTDRFTYWYRDGVGGHTSATGQAQINNTNYDDGDGTLGTLTAQRYGAHWVYLVHDGSLHVVYGTGDYTLAQALDAGPPSDIPGLLSAYGTLIAKILVIKSATNLYSIEVPWETTFASAGVTDHGELGGLTDDDHTQYILVDASRDFTATPQVNGTAVTLVGHTHVEADITDLQAYLLNITGESIGDLSDVTIGTPSPGDVLTWNVGGYWEQATPVTGVTDHGALTGLTDDDHTQYLLVDGTRAMTGGLEIGSVLDLKVSGSIANLESTGSIELTLDSDNNSTAHYLDVRTDGTVGLGTLLFRINDDGQINAVVGPFGVGAVGSEGILLTDGAVPKISCDSVLQYEVPTSNYHYFTVNGSTVATIGATYLTLGSSTSTDLKISEPTAGEWTVEAQSTNSLVLKGTNVYIDDGGTNKAKAASVKDITATTTTPTGDYPYGTLHLIY